MNQTEKIIKAVRGIDLLLSQNGLPETTRCELDFGGLSRSEIELVAAEYDVTLHYPTVLLPEIWVEIHVGRIKLTLASRKYTVKETWSAA